MDHDPGADRGGRPRAKRVEAGSVGALEDELGTPALAEIQAAAVVAAEMQGERADWALERYARPAVMLALAHGLYGRAQRREAAGVLRVAAGSELRLAVLRCPTPESAHRLRRRLPSMRAAGWAVVTAGPSENDALVLLAAAPPEELRRAAAPPEELRRAAARLRERHFEIQAIGVSGGLADVAEMPVARAQALTAVGIDSAGGATLFEDPGNFRELADAIPAARAEAMVEKTLGVLIRNDAARGTRLVETLGAYVAHSGRIRQAARALGIHPNTFHQRLQRATDLSGFDLHDCRTLGTAAGVAPLLVVLIVTVVLALEWDRMLRARTVIEEKSD